MASLYVTEFSGCVKGTHNAPAALTPPVAEQKVSYTTAASSSAFNAATTLVRLVGSADAWVAFVASPTATVSSMYLPSGVVEYFAVRKNHKLSVYDGAS